MKKYFTCVSLLVILYTYIIAFSSLGCFANNIQITNAGLGANDVSAGTNNVANFTTIRLDISWENSWRTDNLNGAGVTNWDAAWIFAKYRVGSGAWQHAWLNNTGHTTPTGSTITIGLLNHGSAFNATTNPGMGAFIYRDANGTGTFSKTNVQLRWNYGANSINDDATIDIRIYALEMVYVPQGSFYVGSGGTETGSFTNGSWTSGNTIPLQITSENAITMGTSAGNLWGTSTAGTSTIGSAGTLAAAFPKGYAAFYCMKYELTQQGYVYFLNTLTYSQQITRTTTAPNSAAGTGALISANTERNIIDIQTSGTSTTVPAVYACNYDGDGNYGEAADGLDIALNYAGWGDVAAYLDWSSLRVMTELEFEKACRGTAAAVDDEFAWGTTGIASSDYTLNNAGLTNEGIASNYSTTNGNCIAVNTSFNTDGPVRVGIFSAHASNTGRVTSGATFYGIMEMSGNVWERAITVGNATGRAYTGQHGNGLLNSSGDHDVTNWPAVADGVGAGIRGGSVNSVDDRVRISGRNNGAAPGTNPGRTEFYGIRGVRTAP